MKKTIYIFLWLVVGYLLSNIFSNLFEIVYLKNIYVYWSAEKGTFVGIPYIWPLLLLISKTLLPALFVIWGYRRGGYFWQVLYVEKRYKRWKWRWF
jgi:hypothetical protein